MGADPYMHSAYATTNLRAVHAGSTDHPYATANCDHDFQDMGVRICVSVPEPGSLALLGAALFGLAGLRRRVK